MNKRKISEDVFLLGAADWNRRLFDALIPLPDGTTYNAYLIEGNKATALIDTTDPSKLNFIMDQLKEIERIDYLIANHAEQDHSGSLPQIAGKYPQARIIATPKCKGMLMDLLQIPEERFETVEDGQSISLGDKSLEFIHTPWVHWPETMCTYLKEAQILFSCDFFGSHYATTDLFVKDQAAVYEAAKRYYAEIMMPFRTVIRKNLDKVMARDVKMIAPSHGPIYDMPAFIMDAYAAWASDDVKNEVVLPYVSMHGSTEAMVRHLTGALAERGVKTRLFDLAATDIGKLAIALVDAATIIIGTPTVHAGPHPAVVAAAHLANALRPKLRFAAVVNSYGWSSKAVERLAELIPNLKVELLPAVICRGYPRENDLRALDALADAIVQKHAAL